MKLGMAIALTCRECHVRRSRRPTRQGAAWRALSAGELAAFTREHEGHRVRVELVGPAEEGTS